MASGILLLQLVWWSFNPSISHDVRSRLPIDFPFNIVVQPELRAAVVRLWAGSQTFRAQCAKIGAHKRYRVAVLLDPVLALNRSYRAQGVLRVYSTGLVTARVTVPHAGRNLDELMPHELEHVIEHIDGIDVTRQVGRYGAGVYDAGRGRVETVRATRVGKQAKDEVYAGMRDVAVAARR